MIIPSVGPACKIKPDFGICNRPDRFYFTPTKFCNKYSSVLQIAKNITSECERNQNNFNTKKECLQTCGDCYSKPEKGPCKANIQRYYFDKDRKICKKFTFGGCKGNGNNYKTKKACFDTCGDCNSDPEGGSPWQGISCLALFQRYYFDQDHKTCKRFIYGGCGGNNNNFQTKKDCSKACQAKPIPDGKKSIF